MQVIIEVYVDADNKVVSNSPLVRDVADIKAYCFDYARDIIAPRRKAEKVAKAFADKAKRHNDSVQDLFPIIELIADAQDVAAGLQRAEAQATPKQKRPRTLPVDASAAGLSS